MKDSGTQRVDEEDIIIIVNKHKKGDRDQKAETFVAISGMHQGESEIKFKLS